MPAVVDLNCDLGEFGDAAALRTEASLLRVVTSVNIACGGHAGDEGGMRRVVGLAQRYSVRIGAHPSYPDRERFGRVSISMSTEALEDSVREQVASLARVCDALGATLAHVKPHGALYHDCAASEEIAHAVARAVVAAAPGAAIIGQCGSRAIERWHRAGRCVKSEAFADRRYASATSLRSRALPGAVIDDPARAAAQAVALALGDEIETDEGPRRIGMPDTIGIHCDTPNALPIARAVRAALDSL